MPPSPKSTIYKAVIIGAGPAGVGVLVRAARIGYFDQLVDLDEAHDRLGIALVHDGPTSSVGCGTLGQYTIRSNTHARALTSAMLDDRLDIEPRECISGTFLEPLRAHVDTVRLESQTSSPAPLSEFGQFLGTVGQALVTELRHRTSSVCLVHTRATSIHLMDDHEPDGDATRGLVRVECITTRVDPSTGQVIETLAQSLVTDRVILAMGGHQRPRLSKAHLTKCFTSGEMLTREGQEKFAKSLAKKKSSSSSSSSGRRSNKVCLVGGSHSAFSVAWTLLQNGPQHSNTNSAPWPEFQSRDITMLHRSPVRCFYAHRREAEQDGLVVKHTTSNSTTVTSANHAPEHQHQAINTFSGLREDAKRLYQDIRTGKETRVRLYQVKDNGGPVATKSLNEASAIVWCCGYQPSVVPILDAQDRDLMSSTETQNFAFDDQARLVLTMTCRRSSSSSAKKSTTGKDQQTMILSQILGTGLGAGLRARVVEDSGEARVADGVSVYQKRGASLILASIFGPQVYGPNASSYEDMVVQQEKQRQEHKKSVKPPAPPPASSDTTSSSGFTSTSLPVPSRMKESSHVQRLLKYRTSSTREQSSEKKKTSCPYCGCAKAFGPTCRATKALNLRKTTVRKSPQPPTARPSTCASSLESHHGRSGVQGLRNQVFAARNQSSSTKSPKKTMMLSIPSTNNKREEEENTLQQSIHICTLSMAAIPSTPA